MLTLPIPKLGATSLGLLLKLLSNMLLFVQ